MSELITIQDLSTNSSSFMERKEFYDKQIEEYGQGIKHTQYVHIIDVFLVNQVGELIIQKRSHTKNHNPGLLDKTIGGHVQRGDTVDYSVMVETIQELQVPSIVFNDHDNFEKRFDLLKEYLQTIALIKHIDSKLYVMPKIMKGRIIPIGNMVHLFFGVYGGRVKNIDAEAKGILFYTIDELLMEINNIPQLFTEDLKILLTHYEPQLREFIASIQTKIKETNI